MSAIFTSIINWLGPKLAMLTGAVLLALTAIFSIRQAGKQAEQIRNIQETLNAIGVRNEIEAKINHMPAATITRKLQRNWRRD